MKKPKQKTELFVMVLLDTLDAPAWRALSHGAQILYIALKRRHRRDVNNNGSIFLSQRDAEAELASSKRYIARWFRELEHYGFIVMTRAGFLGTEGKGKAPHWRLTELACGDDPPTRDFLKWNGVRMAPRKISRGTKVPQGWGTKVPHIVGH
jgi:hypothetical protein